MKVSACIIALNEETYIARAINSLKKIECVDEIVIVDGGSTDKTVEICEQLGCSVFIKPWEQDFAQQRNYALSMCKNDWVITADADEWYPESTRKMLTSLFNENLDKFSAVKLHEINEIGCEDLNAAPMNPNDIKNYCEEFNPETSIDSYLRFEMADGRTIILSRTFRVLNRTKGKWVNKIHEVFQTEPGFEVFEAPWRYVIHHQKSRVQQNRSESKYYAIDYDVNTYFYKKTFDDFDGVTSQKSVHTLDEIFFKIITEVKPCDKFIEAGSFDGNMSRLIQTTLPNTRAFAFEANPYNYEHFKPLFENSNAQYIHLAVSDKNEDVTFRVQRNNNGHEMPVVKGNDSILLRTEPNVEYENFTIPSVTLDSYFADKINATDSVALWVDLEGAAYQALEGAVNTLANVDVIKIEVESYRHWKDQKLDEDIRVLLSHYGFFPIIRDYEYPNQYNILFCKKPIVWLDKFQALMSSYSYNLATC